MIINLIYLFTKITEIQRHKISSSNGCKCSFPKRVKRHSRKWAYNINVKFDDCVFGKQLFTYVYMKNSFPKRIKRLSRKWICNAYSKFNIYIHIYEKLFSKTGSPTFALALQHQFLDCRLSRYGKELFEYNVIHMKILNNSLFYSLLHVVLLSV